MTEKQHLFTLIKPRPRGVLKHLCQYVQPWRRGVRAVLIVEQSATTEVNGLSAGRPWLMCDLEGQPIAQQQTPVTLTLATLCQCGL